MLIKYKGNRPCVSICCTGRVTYYFGPENSFTQDVLDKAHASQILSSAQHAFEVVFKEPPKEMPIEKKTEPKIEIKKEKKHGKK